MALTARLTQSNQANMGTPTRFVAAVSNPTGSPVNVYSLQPTVRTQTGVAAACSIDPPVAAPGVGVAQVNGSQFNVQVGANSTVYFPFTIQFFGSATVGPTAQANAAPNFWVGVVGLDSGGAVFSAPELDLAINRPVYGTSPGAPPNSTPVAPGGVDFSTPVNSPLVL